VQQERNSAGFNGRCRGAETMDEDYAGLETLVANDSLGLVTGVDVPGFIHRDHRWVLPLIAWAQAKGHISRPSTLVMFDRHHDAAPTIARNSAEGTQLLRRCRNESNLADFISLCADHLTKNDGDWVKAGMDSGVIGDAVVFGVSDHFGMDRFYVDIDGQRHALWLLSHVGDELAYQGKLTDRAYTDHYKELWNILAWDPGTFRTPKQRWILDFDLDYFAVDAGDLGVVFPWPEKAYRSQFFQPCNARYVEGWTARMFLDEIFARCGLLTIAREPDYCGGESDCDQIFRDMNRFLFDGNLVIQDF